jgi:hypothetical protein
MLIGEARRIAANIAKQQLGCGSSPRLLLEIDKRELLPRCCPSRRRQLQYPGAHHGPFLSDCGHSQAAKLQAHFFKQLALPLVVWSWLEERIPTCRELLLLETKLMSGRLTEG